MSHLPANRGIVQLDFCGWPAFALRQKGLNLQVVPSVGGRLMGIALDGVELCFINPALHGLHDTGIASDWAGLCGDWGFPLWGGGKTWVAPQSAWPADAPHRDLDSGVWQVIDQWCDAASMGIALQSPVCRSSGLQLRRTLSLPNPDTTAWQIGHELVNTGTAPVYCGVWDVLMLLRPAEVSVRLPAAQRASGGHWSSAVQALPGEPSVAQLMDSGVLSHKLDQIQLACQQSGQFKCGFASDSGHLSADWKTATGRIRYSRHSPVQPNAEYAHGHPLEVFNAPRLPYFELETHSPARLLQPGEAMHYTIDEAVGALVF